MKTAKVLNNIIGKIPD